MTEKKGRARACARDDAPQTAAELMALALDVYDSAMEARFVSRDGVEYPQPNHGAAVKAIEVMGKLIGVLGDGRNMGLDQLRSELDRLGFRLEPKAKPKAV